ncbi:hypothetical protein P692DRAFT_20877081 [Suillus brevipes Sb2]|nr:hypothetical protein P692DRAFT_20877081 [Suillus brevipes Sb2]
MDSDSSSVSSNSEPENELSIFKRIGEHLDYISICTSKYKVRRETKLAQALDNLVGSPFVSFKSRSGTSATFRLLVKGEDAGTWFKPDVEVLQNHATTSPFGRGEETVIDPTYRNGTELKADELTFGVKEDRELGGCYRWFLGDIREELHTSISKPVNKIYYPILSDFAGNLAQAIDEAPNPDGARPIMGEDCAMGSGWPGSTDVRGSGWRRAPTGIWVIAEAMNDHQTLSLFSLDVGNISEFGVQRPATMLKPMTAKPASISKTLN